MGVVDFRQKLSSVSCIYPIVSIRGRSRENACSCLVFHAVRTNAPASMDVVYGSTFHTEVYNILVLSPPPISCCGTAINIMMADGMVSIGDGKSGSESSPTRRRGSNFGLTNTSAAPSQASRVKRSPQGSVAGESSTKGSERDEMEEVSNEEGVYPH